MHTYKATLGLLFLLAIGLNGCGDSSKLTRDRAKDVIQDHISFRIVETSIPVGPDVTVGFGWDQYKDLLQKGFINYAESGYFRYKINLTDASKKFVTRQEDNGATVYLRACEREITEITGIEQPTEKKATVHFKYRTVKLTPFSGFEGYGNYYKKEYCSDKVEDGVISLALFDDGWRVEESRFSP